MTSAQEDDKDDALVTVLGTPYRKKIILADVNIPYKCCLDRRRNDLYFCINADEFSDQSFHAVVLNLNTGVSTVIPGIRNGFASTVDQVSGTVYLGGSDGIFKFNHDKKNIEHPAIVKGIDVFDMQFKKNLYFVDTAHQDLYIYKSGVKKVVPELEDYLIHHFVIDKNDSLIFINTTGLFRFPKGAKNPTLCFGTGLSIRGMTTDLFGRPYCIAQDGIYTIDELNHELLRILPLENGYGLAFDRDNNIIYTEERTVTKLTQCEKS